MANLAQRFSDYIAQNDLVSRDDKILLTVSGGVDSMVMLHLFTQAGYNVGVAHCNFQLRAKESDEDEVMVANQVAALGVEFYNQRFETTAEMERTGESMEMAARRLRYAWFERLRVEHGYTSIAIAHHADDSIETFFINLLRGTGLRGLTGINTQIGKIVRPLMFASRREILEFAIANKIPYREDSSNRSTKYLRNKIRLGLVPRIREINPKFTDLMRRNISRLTEAQEFITQSIEQIRTQAIVDDGAGVYRLRLDAINEQLPRDFVIYELLSSQFGFKGDVIDSLIHSMHPEASGRRFYSKEYVAYNDRGEILITLIGDEDSCETQIERGTLRSYCGNSVLQFENIDIDLLDSLNVAENIALLDYDKLQFPLTLRRWREGDAFIPFGMNGRKKVSDLLIDAKVSVLEKQRQFVLLSGDDIVWVVGRRTDDRYRLTKSSENVLKITKEIL